MSQALMTGSFLTPLQGGWGASLLHNLDFDITEPYIIAMVL